MDKLFEHTAAFSHYLYTTAQLSHKNVVQPVLVKLLDMAKIYEGEHDIKEERLLLDSLENLINIEAKFSGSGGANFLTSLMSVIEHLFARLIEQVDPIEKLNGEKQEFLAQIVELGYLVEKMDFAVADVESPIIVSLVRNENYVHHYKSKHRDFESHVLVVLWKSKLPGPYIATEDLPILYVHHLEPLDGARAAWGKPKPEREKKNVEDAVSSAEVAQAAIQQHQKALFENHSNLVAIRVSEAANGGFYVELVVACKNFLPSTNPQPLPRSLGDVPTRVSAGIVKLCGALELTHHRPLLPGAGFAAGGDSVLDLNVKPSQFVQPSVGTVGGFVSYKGVIYGVTCAHCIQLHPASVHLHPPDTPAMQPSAMGLILKAAKDQPKLMEQYERLKQHNLHSAMTYLVRELDERTNGAFSVDLATAAQFGTVRGGVLGPLDNDGAVVDVGLIELGPAVEYEAHCRPSVLIPPSPPLLLGEGATAPIMPLASMVDAPPFHVYGKGAVSDGTMQAILNPQEAQIYIRNVEPGSLGLVHRCLHAAADARCWQPGDSGTWCWTESGMLVGMGMAYAEVAGVRYCCILPMDEVEAAIKQVLL